MRKIKDVVNENVITVKKDDTLSTVIELMRENGIGRIPVIENDQVIGVVTRDDILIREEKAPLPPIIAFWDLLITLPNNKNFQEKVRKMSTFKVDELMSTNYLTCNENDDLEGVITKMLEEGYPYSLVVDGKKLVGIITKSDLINNCFKKS